MLSGLRNTSGSNDVKYPANCQSRVGGEDTDKIYQSKPDKKIVRFVIVIGYVFSVSFGAILLSLYYLFIWNPYSDAINKSTSLMTSTSISTSVQAGGGPSSSSILITQLESTTSLPFETIPSPQRLISEQELMEKKFNEMAQDAPSDVFVRDINFNSRKHRFTNVKDWKKHHRYLFNRGNIPV